MDLSGFSWILMDFQHCEFARCELRAMETCIGKGPTSQSTKLTQSLEWSLTSQSTEEPKVDQSRPKVIPKSVQSGPKVGPKLAQSQPKDGPKSAQRRPKVEPKSAQRRPKVGPKAASSRTKVSQQSAQSQLEVGPSQAPLL